MKAHAFWERLEQLEAVWENKPCTLYQYWFKYIPTTWPHSGQEDNCDTEQVITGTNMFKSKISL